MAELRIFEVRLKLKSTKEIIIDIFAAYNISHCKGWIDAIYGDTVEVLSYLWY